MAKKNWCFSAEDMYAAAHDISKSGLKYAKVYEEMLKQAAFTLETFVGIPNFIYYISRECKERAEHLGNYFGTGFKLHKQMNYKPIHDRKENK